MPYIETVEDIVKQMADRLCIYGAHDDQCSDKRPCRVCWVPGMHQRLRLALENELRLEAVALADKGQG